MASGNYCYTDRVIEFVLFNGISTGSTSSISILRTLGNSITGTSITFFRVSAQVYITLRNSSSANIFIVVVFYSGLGRVLTRTRFKLLGGSSGSFESSFTGVAFG